MHSRRTSARRDKPLQLLIPVDNDLDVLSATGVSFDLNSAQRRDDAAVRGEVMVPATLLTRVARKSTGNRRGRAYGACGLSLDYHADERSGGLKIVQPSAGRRPQRVARPFINLVLRTRRRNRLYEDTGAAGAANRVGDPSAVGRHSRIERRARTNT